MSSDIAIDSVHRLLDKHHPASRYKSTNGCDRVTTRTAVGPSSGARRASRGRQSLKRPRRHRPIRGRPPNPSGHVADPPMAAKRGMHPSSLDRQTTDVVSFGSCRFTWRPFIIALASIELAGALLLPTSVLNANARNYFSSANRRCSRFERCRKWNRFATSRSLSHGISAESEGGGERASRAFRKEEKKYWTLPRLYVGPRRGMPRNLPLSPGARVPLSPGQAHYLTNVMRLLKKRRNGRMGGDDNATRKGCIRIFNGEDGEWLAEVHISSGGNEDNDSGGNGGNRRRGRSPKRNKDANLFAICILRLRAQDCDGDGRPWILFGPLKKQQTMKALIQKCTELGVGRMIPVESDHVEGGALTALLSENSGRDASLGTRARSNLRGSFDGDECFGGLEVQSIEAAEQCERLDVPVITNNILLARHSNSRDSFLWNVRDLVRQWCLDWEEGQDSNGDDDSTGGGIDSRSTVANHIEKRVLFICRERGDINDGIPNVIPVLQALQRNKRATPAFLVGPEGGWSVEEEKYFDEVCSKYSGFGYEPVRCVSLGSTVLRAETASLMAVGAWSLFNDSQ